MTTLRAMTPQDITAGFALTQQLNWSHRLEDWQLLLQLGEGVVAEENGHYLGSAIGWRWGDGAATVGLVIVNHEARGRGIGQQIMAAILEKFPHGYVRLHATEMGKALYEKLGFQVYGEIRQHQTVALAQEPPIVVPDGLTMRDAQWQDRDAIGELDFQATGMQRARLLHYLIDSGKTVVLQDAHQQIQGFASMRRFGHGWTIGPVMANNFPAAQALVATLMQGMSGKFVRIDTPATLPLADWVLSLGLVQVDAPTVMVHGTPWRAQPDGVQMFGLVSPALG